MKILEAIVAVVLGIWLIVVWLPGPITSSITEAYSEPFTVATTVNQTTATEVLSYDNYYSDLTGMAATSDDGGDFPVVFSYNPDTKATVVGGLQTNTTRILTISYTREAGSTSLFYGFGAIMRMVPLILLLLLVGVLALGAYRRHMGG
jgi:hypothetical protein